MTPVIHIARLLNAPAPASLAAALAGDHPVALVHAVAPGVPMIPGSETLYHPQRRVIWWGPDSSTPAWVQRFEALHEAYHAQTWPLALLAWPWAAWSSAGAVCVAGALFGPGRVLEIGTVALLTLALWRSDAEALADGRAQRWLAPRLDASASRWLAGWVGRRRWIAWDALAITLFPIGLGWIGAAWLQGLLR